MSKAEADIALSRASAEFMYRLNNMNNNDNESKWRAMAKLSNAKKRELENFRKNKVKALF